MIRHTIKLEGEAAQGARVSIHVLAALSHALVEATQRALRYRVDGRSNLHGKADWLDKATQFELVALESGSTVLAWEAPTLGEAVPHFFDQLPLWETGPRRGQTAFEVLKETAREAADGNAESDLLDKNILDSLYGFRKVLSLGYDAITFDGLQTAGKPVRITKQDMSVFHRLSEDAPASRQAIVTGWLDELSASKNSFRLRLPNGQSLRGLLPDGELAAFGKLWNQRIVVDGEVSYRPSGTPSLIIASHFQQATSQDTAWEQIPQPTPRSLAELKPRIAPQSGSNGMEHVFGRWPGTETDEEVRAILEAIE